MYKVASLSRVPLFSFVFIVLLSLARPALAQDVRIPYDKFTLSNGLTVLVHEDHKAPVVAIDIWYHVGSKNEPRGKNGFAHLFEHLMFGGSEHVKERYIDAMERVGAARLNGTTNNDRTNYFETVPVSALDYALFLESDRMGHFYGTINQQTLDLQRGVVENEKRQDENQPYAVSDELIANNTYPAGHPYSWTTIGSMEDLNAASLSDVQEWFKKYYGPSNAALVLAGDIDLKSGRALADKYFGDIPPGPPISHQNVWVAKMTGVHTQEVEDRVPQPRVYDVWNVAEYGNPDADYLDLVANILSAGRDSRLYKRLVYDGQIATGVQAHIDMGEIGSQFSIIATAKAGGSLDPVNQAVKEELDRFMTNGPTADELERAKTGYEANLVRSLDRVGQKAEILVRGQVFAGNPEEYRLSLERVRNATAQELRDAARRWLSDGLYQLAVLPYAPSGQLSAAIDRSRLPEVGPSPDLKLPPFQRATLSNGLKIVLAERHELPLVDFRMIVNAGYAADHFATPGTATLTSALLTGGTDKYSALEISDLQQKLGAQLGAATQVDDSVVRLSVLKSKLDESLDLFADVLLHPTFPQADFSRQQKLQIAAIVREKNGPMSAPMRVLPSLLFGKDHPYGLPLSGSGSEASIAKITRADLVKFHDTWFKPDNSTLIVVGDTSMAEVQSKLEKLFAGWKPGSVPRKAIAKAGAPKAAEVYLIDKPGAQQSILIAGTVAPPQNSPDAIAIETWNNILGGTFSGRVNMNLREDKHWSYGARTEFFSAREQRPFIVMAPVQSDKTGESLDELTRELHDIVRSRPPTAAELAAAKGHEILALAGSRETMTQVGDAIEEVVEYGLPDNYFSTYASKVEALDVTRLTRAAGTFFDPDHMIWIVVGDRAKIEQGVRARNLGTLYILDDDGNVLGDTTASKTTSTPSAR